MAQGFLLSIVGGLYYHATPHGLLALLRSHRYAPDLAAGYCGSVIPPPATGLAAFVYQFNSTTRDCATEAPASPGYATLEGVCCSRQAAIKFEQDHAATIKDYDFKAGRLVLIRNTAIEKSLNRKMRPRYLGLLIVLARNRGGTYIVCDLDRSVYDRPIAAFRVIPYFARDSIPLPLLNQMLDVPPDCLNKTLQIRLSRPGIGHRAQRRRSPFAGQPVRNRHRVMVLPADPHFCLFLLPSLSLFYSCSFSFVPNLFRYHL